jgi:hypothetical protein
MVRKRRCVVELVTKWVNFFWPWKWSLRIQSSMVRSASQAAQFSEVGWMESQSTQLNYAYLARTASKH